MEQKVRYRAVQRAAMPGDMIRVTVDDEELGLKKGDEFRAMVVDSAGFVQCLKGKLSPKNYKVLVKY